MKKSKLLMPLTGIAALGAAITPMAVLTSCKKATISEIDVDYDNAKLSYYYGEKVDPTNLVITAKYSDNSKKEIPWRECKFTPDITQELTTDNEEVKIEYNGKEFTYPIIVCEDLLTYQWREEVAKGSGQLTLNEAMDKYFGLPTEQIIANMKDDVFWHLSSFAKLANSVFGLEEFAHVEASLKSLIAPIITAFIQNVLGTTFAEVGWLYEAKGQVTNVEIVDYDKTTTYSNYHVAYINADITMNLKAKMVKRVDGVKTDNGAMTITSVHNLFHVPFYMGTNQPNEPFTVHPANFMIAKGATKNPKYTDWSITRSWLSAWVEADGKADSKNGTITWNKNKLVDKDDPTQTIAGDPLDFISWDPYYLENYEYKAG